jgi:YgiT-type zinc finger domain-containing protein
MPSNKTPYNYGKCHVCGGSLVERKVDQDFRIKGRLIVVREVPAGVCQRCGEKVVRAEVGKQLTAIVTDVKSLRRAPTIAVPVVAFESWRV